MEYTLRYTEKENEIDGKMPLSSYDDIQECIDWADDNGVEYYLLYVTEWDGDDITAQTNLQAVVDDGERDSLDRYSNY